MVGIMFGTCSECKVAKELEKNIIEMLEFFDICPNKKCSKFGDLTSYRNYQFTKFLGFHYGCTHLRITSDIDFYKLTVFSKDETIIEKEGKTFTEAAKAIIDTWKV